MPAASAGANMPPPAVPADTAPVPGDGTDPVTAILDSINIPDWSTTPATVSPVLSTNIPIPVEQSTQILREYKLSSVIYKRYARPQRGIDVFIYNFPNGLLAFGAYSSLRIGSSNIVVRGDLSSEDDQFICILKGSRFITIHSQIAEDDMSKTAASAIADQLAQRIDEHSDPRAYFRGLPYLDRMSGTEHIFMGPVAARKFIPLPFIQMLRLSEARLSTAATYQFPHPEPDRAKAMIIDYGDPKLAFDIYNQYSGKLVDTFRTRQLSEMMQVSKTGQTYLLCGRNGTRLFLVAGAKRKISPMVLARQLAN